MNRNQTGKVKWFDDKKGWGFLLSPKVDADIFVHYRSIMGEGHKTLHEGQDVQFTLIQGDKGYLAAEVATL